MPAAPSAAASVVRALFFTAHNHASLQAAKAGVAFLASVQPQILGEPDEVFVNAQLDFGDKNAWDDSGDTRAYVSLDFTDDDLQADLTRAYIRVAEAGHHDGLAGSNEYNKRHW